LDLRGHEQDVVVSRVDHGEQHDDMLPAIHDFANTSANPVSRGGFASDVFSVQSR